MKVVVDTNILFSFFRENPVRSLIVNAKDFGLQLFTPAYAFGELRNNKKYLMKYAKLKTDEEIEFILKSLLLFIETKPMQSFEECKERAKIICPDQKDTPFFALALKLKANIWSNEPLLKRQSQIKVVTTAELRRLVDQ